MLSEILKILVVFVPQRDSADVFTHTLRNSPHVFMTPGADVLVRPEQPVFKAVPVLADRHTQHRDHVCAEALQDTQRARSL